LIPVRFGVRVYRTGVGILQASAGDTDNKEGRPLTSLLAGLW